MTAIHPSTVSARPKEFLPFQLDPVNQRLWCHSDQGEEQRILLPPKAFALLRYLVEHPGRLVTQEELLGALCC